MTTTLQRPTPAARGPTQHTSAAGRTAKKILPSGLQLIILAVLVLFPVGFVLLAAFTDTSPGPRLAG